MKARRAGAVQTESSLVSFRRYLWSSGSNSSSSSSFPPTVTRAGSTSSERLRIAVLLYIHILNTAGETIPISLAILLSCQTWFIGPNQNKADTEHRYRNPRPDRLPCCLASTC